MLLVVKIIGTDFRQIVNNSYIRKIYSSLSSNLEKTQMKLKQDTVLKNGEYKIIKTLGEGGFGITYLAYQIHLKRNVVIKEFYIKEYCDRDSDTSKVFLGTSGNRDIVVRFLNKFHNEALNIAALKHPNIISIYDVFEENNTAYYVMEYHPDGSLGRLVDGNNGMSKERALHYIYQVADVLKYIHSKHIMHLDIKPDNILLDENDNAILIDFGLAKVYDGATNQQQTRSSSIAAYSPGYAPLEQYNPSGISSFSPTTDIYSLGATLFTLLTGKCPPLAIELINNDFIAQELLRYNVDKAIIDTIVRSMSPTKVQRPQSIGEFLAMLDAGETAVPQPASRIAPQPASQVAPQPASRITPQPASQVAPQPASQINPQPASKVSLQPTSQVAPQAASQINSQRKAEEDVRRNAEEKRKRKAEQEARIKAVEERKRNTFETKIFNVNGVEFKMVAVEGGTFDMGCKHMDLFKFLFDNNLHSVALRNYYIGETLVTQKLWQAVMGGLPSYYLKGYEYPVYNASYKDCEKFIDKLNHLLAGKLPDGCKFCLPTEAQWEFAARGGNKGKNNNYKYSGSNNIDDVAWYLGNSGEQSHLVKQKQPNELGLYDMTGNVWEWCSDWYGSNYYSSSPYNNPKGPSTGFSRVLRGGGCDSIEQYCRVEYRAYKNIYSDGLLDCGLRLAID